MARRKLKLNNGKTEIIIWGNLKNVSVANFGVMSFGDKQLVPCESAKNLGVVLNSSLSFRSHIDFIVKTYNFHIHNLHMIKDFVNRKNLVTLVHSLIVSKVDFSIYIPWPFPPVWGLADNTKETTKQWGFYSVLLAMMRDPAEFGWHCWSNRAHPPPSSTTYVAS